VASCRRSGDIDAIPSWCRLRSDGSDGGDTGPVLLPLALLPIVLIVWPVGVEGRSASELGLRRCPCPALGDRLEKEENMV
jgi:hypothetical protein